MKWKSKEIKDLTDKKIDYSIRYLGYCVWVSLIGALVIAVSLVGTLSNPLLVVNQISLAIGIGAVGMLMASTAVVYTGQVHYRFEKRVREMKQEILKEKNKP